ncbi:hypothetical protein [Methylorubrum sp. SB2]|uniref:hypothetical protein n=1 Tax=Methylorubrum subtropicum TaxID=3138812 RepID=UPI00313DBB54
MKPDPTLLGRTFECHDRGAILVGAVFDGFYRTYEGRIADLLRIATNGSGELPAGHLHPDLVERVANEASVLADHVLRMCLRAFDYLPPVDVTFGDFLRALVTADLDVNSEDRFELRFNMIEAFRIRGIFPEGVFSLVEESLTLPTCDDPGLDLDPHLVELVQLLFAINARALDWAGRVVQRTRPSSGGLAAFQSVVRESDEDPDDADEEGSLLPSERGLKRKIGQGLGHYVSQRAAALGFEPGKPSAVVSFHPVHRIGLDQRVLVEFVVQFVQTDETRSAEFGGIPMRAGLTAIFSADGRLRTVVSRPMPHPGVTEPFAAAAGARADRQRAFVEAIDLGDPRLAWGPDGYEAVRMKDRETILDMNPPSGEGYLALLGMRAASLAKPGASTAPEPFGRQWIDPTPSRPLDAAARSKLRDLNRDLPLELATALDKAINNTSLMLLFSIGDAHLLFPGDAQWGTWREVLKDPELCRLLEQCCFYKVGHHGSHNATPISFVSRHLGKQRQEVWAMVPVTSYSKWPDIPRAPLIDALKGKVTHFVRSDGDRRADAGFRWQGDLYVEAAIPVG